MFATSNKNLEFFFCSSQIKFQRWMKKIAKKYFISQFRFESKFRTNAVAIKPIWDFQSQRI